MNLSTTIRFPHPAALQMFQLRRPHLTGPQRLRRATRWISLLALTLSLLAGSAAAAEPVNTLERKGLWGYEPNGIAIRGYDPVAYFTLGAPTPGSSDHSTEWMGATWHFANPQHLALFQQDPEKYAPQYGGYCAFGVAKDSLVKIEPEFWSIIDDKLYLNYDAGVQRKWEKDIGGFISAADGKFEKLLQQQ